MKLLSRRLGTEESQRLPGQSRKGFGLVWFARCPARGSRQEPTEGRICVAHPEWEAPSACTQSLTLKSRWIEVL